MHSQRLFPALLKLKNGKFWKMLNLSTLKEKGIRKFCIRTWSLWEKLGIHVSPNHFYWPIPDTTELTNYDFSQTFPTEGIDFDDQAMLNLLSEIAKYREEYFKIYTCSGYESNGDGAILYGMIRKYKPRRIIEIGSGFSTKVSGRALQQNQSENFTGEIVSIEPYPSAVLLNVVNQSDHITLIQEKVEKVGNLILESLSAGDVLFIDSSHVVKCGNDVHFIYLNLLPKIPVGTIVHIHDIRFPYEYPREWVIKAKKFWNEQYLLQMFLSFNDSFKIVFAGNYMYNKYPKIMRESLVGLGDEENGWPGCFWITRVK